MYGTLETLLQCYNSRIGLLGSIFRLQNNQASIASSVHKGKHLSNGRHISKIIFPSKLHVFIGRWGEMSVVLTWQEQFYCLMKYEFKDFIQQHDFVIFD